MKKINWKKLATPKELGMWGGFLFLVLVLALRNYIFPVNASIHNSTSQLEAKRLELAAYEKIVKAKNAPVSKAVNGKVEVGKQAIARKVREIFEASNTTADVVSSELIAELTKPEYEKLAHLEKYSFGAKVQKGGFSQKDIDLKLIGSYDGISEYLTLIRELPQIVKVESIEIKPLDQSNRGLVRLTAKATLFVGDPKAASVPQSTTSRSDTATDILMELNSSHYSKVPFAAKPRELGSWSVRDLMLTATMAGSAHPSALINGKLFEVGDEVADFKLAEVRPHEVVLQRGDVEVVLKISDKPGTVSDDKEDNFIRRSESSSSRSLLNGGDSETNPDEKLEKSNDANDESLDSQKKKSLNDDYEDEGGGADGPNGSGKGGGSAQGEDEEEEGDGKLAASGGGGGGQSGGSSGQQKVKGNVFISGEVLEGDPASNEGNDSSEGSGSDSGSGKRKLKPSEVEDIAGVPFEDLEDPLESLWG